MVYGEQFQSVVVHMENPRISVVSAVSWTVGTTDIFICPQIDR